MVKRLWGSGTLALGAAWVASLGAACDEPGGRSVGQLPVDGADVTVARDTAVASDGAGTDANVVDTAVGPDGGSSALVDPACIDGQYRETPPDDEADISGLVAGYSSADYLGFVDDVLAARYPLGRYLVTTANELGTARFGNCITRFTRDRGTAQGIFEDLSTVVHECGHIADLSSAGFSNSVFLVTEDLEFDCSSAAARQGKTFERSRLNGDAYGGLYPGDFYKDVYLDGDPDDGNFDSGDQGYDSVLEEATQYINSLVTDWVFRDQRRGSVSARDGILTFLWYIERYLHMARLEFPATYSLITTNTCWRELTLTLWGRAWLYLELTDGDRSLGIDDATIEALVMDPELLGEIDRIRQAAGCP